MKHEMKFDKFDRLFRYEPETGHLIRKTQGVKARKKCAIGTIAGTLRTEGYVYTGVDRVNFYNHRIAWLLTHGKVDPLMTIDHINGVRDDNRLINLRQVPHKENMRNAVNAVGKYPLGVTKDGNRYKARVTREYKEIIIGFFATPQEASNAYQQYRYMEGL